jgi:asparagine synthetase B (glutamine-hydrolysing)
MCGLSGELRLDGTLADIAAVARMTGAMEPRGPDGSGLWAHGPIALGHRRLKIIDLSDKAAQPMVDSELGRPGSSTAASITTRRYARPCAPRVTDSSPRPTQRCC